jgi:ankyrin repeat protein
MEKLPIHHACRTGSLDLIRLLHDQGNVSAADLNRCLLIACARQNPFNEEKLEGMDCVEYLFDLGADIEADDKFQ